jgi:HK97 family phage portal protein
MRGFFGGLLQRQSSGAGVPTSGMIPPLGSVQSASGILISQATAMTVSAVYAAVNGIACDMATCGAKLVEPQPDGSHKTITDHPIAALLLRPNRIQTWYEFCRDMFVAFLLRGNAYAVILRNSRGVPTELIQVNPDAVMMLEASDGSIFYNMNRIGLFQIAMLRDFPTAIPAEDVFHLRGITFNMLIAVSTIGLHRDTIGLAQAQSQQQSRWMANGARPSVVLMTPRTLTEEAAKRLKASWNDFASGLQNVGKTAVLEDGVEAKPLMLSAVDLQFINQIGLTIQDVGRIFNYPIRKLQQPDTSRGSTIIQEDQSYVNSNLLPKIVMLQQKFAFTFDLEKDGVALKLDPEELLRADPLTRYNLGRIGVLSGLLATNEWRRSENLPPVPGGDEVRAPVNLAALGSDMTGTAPDGAGRPAGQNPPAPGVPTGAGAAPEDDAASVG